MAKRVIGYFIFHWQSFVRISDSDPPLNPTEDTMKEFLPLGTFSCRATMGILSLRNILRISPFPVELWRNCLSNLSMDLVKTFLPCSRADSISSENSLLNHAQEYVSQLLLFLFSIPESIPFHSISVQSSPTQFSPVLIAGTGKTKKWKRVIVIWGLVVTVSGSWKNDEKMEQQ